jgi:uncharacterized integral membrane protein
MGKVRLIFGVVVIIVFFIFALFNGGQGHSTNVQFFLKKWTVSDVPVWGIIYITLAVGVLVGFILRGGRKKKKEHT